MPKNTVQYPRPGLEPGPLDLDGSALTMGPQRLPVREFWSRVTMDKRIDQKYVANCRVKQTNLYYFRKLENSFSKKTEIGSLGVWKWELEQVV